MVEGKINADTWVELSKEITPELRREGLAREVIRHVQSARKSAGLNIDDRIELHLETEDAELVRAIDEYGEVIASETLATITDNLSEGTRVIAKVEGGELTVDIKKA
jgi:isoleucyl-tRNA synthetase